MGKVEVLVMLIVALGNLGCVGYWGRGWWSVLGTERRFGWSR